MSIRRCASGFDFISALFLIYLMGLEGEGVRLLVLFSSDSALVILCASSETFALVKYNAMKKEGGIISHCNLIFPMSYEIF